MLARSGIKTLNLTNSAWLSGGRPTRSAILGICLVSE